MTTNILLADDAPLFRSFVKTAVNMSNIEANYIEIDDGKKLFAAYERTVPDITIIDHNLPQLDVLDFAKKIRDIHPIAIIIVFVDSVNHGFVKDAKAAGVEEVVFKSIGQFAFGTLIKKLAARNISKLSAHDQKSQQNLTNALTMSTLDKSSSANQYVKLTNATLKRRIENIQTLKKLGGDFDSTIKSLYTTKPVQENKQQTSVNSASPNSPNFFIRELSNEQLIEVLRDKIKQLKETKGELEHTNKKLNDTVTELEKTKRTLITQNEQLEEQIRAQIRVRLKSEKLVAIGELSARIAHDLRNPLNVVKNTLEILKTNLADRLTESEMQQWKRLDRGVYRMSHQIEDVLDFIKQRPLEKTKTLVSIILADVLEKTAMPENVKLSLPHNDAEILCDTEKIESVFVNLILNAVQAIDGRQGRIEIIIHDDLKSSNFTTIEIKDNGPGIPDYLKEKVFDPLFTTRQIGTGLGLTSCKRIIEAHEGTITFESKVGVGTSFFIILPNKTEWENIQKADKSATAKAPTI